MRLIFIVALCALLGACAASVPEVRARLGQEYIGQNVDRLVVRLGPPSSSFRMNSGQTSYVWQVGSETQIQVRGTGTSGSSYVGSADTFTCKVSAIASPTGIVSQLDVQDTRAEHGILGVENNISSLCGEKLGMQH